MNTPSRWPAALLVCALASCALEGSEVSFFGGGGSDAQMPARADAASDGRVFDAKVDSSLDGSASPLMDSGLSPLMEASVVVSEPGAEVGRLAGFTAAHNAARARLAATPALPSLRWSNEIALVAQAYADKLAAGCLNTLMHSELSERHNWGENLASYGIMGGTGREPNGSAEDAVALWESELSCYTFGPFEVGTNDTCSAACSRYGGCGHYTQLVWRSTLRVGCGVADCNDGPWRKTYWVCNYDPAGNFRGQFPY